ncbi:Iron (Metal) dependent repressor, DtxR family [Desulfamplus magnetovallimortis]|uniref:Transcriptional regulator MntR n=2 Tax=Desulfamplus magnetovallimortis TaxID=1246637 RepID=A0A1W1HAR8_9BACT|nr:Iron (Metal) dependent repressor, DtxR family [Desulfamplus magnetovallimortis]
MHKRVDLTESLEDYLETILMLEEANHVARSRDIAANMGIQRGSVTSMLKNLAEKELINYEPYGYITLTPEGKNIAREITKRHALLKDFFTRVVQIDSEKADVMACKMEHSVDRDSLEKLTRFIEFIDKCPRTGKEWIDSFKNFCIAGEKDWSGCFACIKECENRHMEKRSDSA